jgi:hypothetical protein
MSTFKSFFGSGERAQEIAPFVSLVLILVTLFAVLFCKMELRRVGYSVLKLTREERKMRDLERQQSIMLAKITRPDRLQSVADARLNTSSAPRADRSSR